VQATVRPRPGEYSRSPARLAFSGGGGETRGFVWNASRVQLRVSQLLGHLSEDASERKEAQVKTAVLT
jgi:hypothetical protein